MATLRWGLLGTARINRAIIAALRDSSRNTLAAVASRSAPKAESYAREWEIPAGLAPYDALLADPSIDVVYIGLPNTMHVEWTVRALEAGKHVLCEKPLAVTVEGVDRIAGAAERTGRVAAEAFMYRHHPLTDAAIRAVRDGRVGELRLIRGAFSYVLTGRNPDIRMDPALGGGSLWDVGCYPVSYACLAADALPERVAGWQETAPGGVDIAFTGQLWFPGGLVAQFDSGFRAAFRAEMEFVGTEGVLRVERPFKAMPDSRILLTRGDRVEAVPFRPDPPYIGEVEDLADAILDAAPPRVPLAETRRTVRALVALYESAEQERTVRV